MTSFVKTEAHAFSRTVSGAKQTKMKSPSQPVKITVCEQNLKIAANLIPKMQSQAEKMQCVNEPLGPDDYVESTQEENEVIQILCDHDSPVAITLSDSDECVAPTLPRVSPKLARMRLKLKKTGGE